jgi:uncharacterized protein YqhQ
VSSPDQPLPVQRDAAVGGQAVLEGVMMRGVSTWAVASRTPDGEIAVESFPIVAWKRVRKPAKLPLVRGVVALAQSLQVGFRALEVSARAQAVDKDEEITKGMWAGTVVVALCVAIGLFFVVPVLLTSLVKGVLGSSLLFWLVEGLVRTAIFLAYLTVLSRQRDLRRVFQYHGAEHKVISCFEAGLPLTPENARRFPRLHPRCGTAFLLVVMIVSIFAFAPVGLPAWWLLLLTRVLGVPVIAGLSFELIKLAGKHRSRRWVQGVMWPGMQLQKLTTQEPDLEQLAVAVAALEAVLEVEDPHAGDMVGLEVVA